MIRVKTTNRTTRESTYISFFPDDTVDTIRQYIGDAVNIHPDRLFLTVTLQRPRDYYTSDPRNWEALYQRLSYRSSAIRKTPFQIYQSQIRSPATAVAYEEYGPEEWKHPPPELSQIYAPSDEFKEQLIFGTEESLSYILPYDYDTALTSKIPGAAYPLPQKNALISTVYPRLETILEFTYTPYETSAETSKPVYFPFLQTTTPEQLSPANIQLLRENSKRLEQLLELAVPEPKPSILRVQYKIPFVDTDFGSALRTRFEQIFYGLTVSDSTPSISFFTSSSETTRHKFFVKNSRTKTPPNLVRWQRWWTLSKPSRSRPTLVLYRGDAPDNFDRIAMTSAKLTLTSYRPEGADDDLLRLQNQLMEWLMSMDAIIPFIAPEDLKVNRWELQDASLSLKYKKKLNEYDLRRFGCITSTFDMSDANTSTFRLLRTDHSVEGLTSLEVKVIQLVKDKGNVSLADIQAELGVSAEVASALKKDVEKKIEDNPNMLTRSFRGFPTMRVGTDSIIVSSVKQIPLSVKYANLLRFILGNGDSTKLNKICPPRKETVRPIVPVKDLTGDFIEDFKALEEEYEDLFGDVEGDAPPEAEKEPLPPPEEEEEKKLKPKAGRSTLYNYFNTRLQQFDSNTFDPLNSKYPKKCEQKHQPIILSEEDLKRLEGTDHDPRKYTEADKMIPTKDPDGLIVCPEYWCMTDEIPLREGDLVDNKCPICNGQLRTNPKDDPRTFSVIARDKAYTYPGMTNYKSPKNDRAMPCCYKTAESKTVKEFEDKYYILSETKTNIPKFRCALLPQKLLDSLFITETYDQFKGDIKRILAPHSGFFRVGMGRPIDTLPRFLGLPSKIPSPRESIENTLKCSFVATWKNKGEDHLEEIMKNPKVNPSLAKIISGIDEAFHKKELTLLQELEYAAICLQCDVFRVMTETNTLGCMFYSPMMKPRSLGIIILQTGDELDILSNVQRDDKSRVKGSDPDDITSFQYRSNVFQVPFKKATYVELEKLRNKACSTKIPSYTDALNALQDILPSLAETEYSIVADPYGRAQAFYVPYKLVLPFQSSPIPHVSQPIVDGYTYLMLPTYEDARSYMTTATKYSKGYEWKEDVKSIEGERVEIMVQSGLRIPVVPTLAEKTIKEPREVIQTVRAIDETNLTFGPEDDGLKQEYSQVSYSSEVFDFLLFELSKDIQERYPELLTVLRKTRPVRPEVEPLLREWFNETTFGVDLKNADQFVSKVRAPCGTRMKDQCSGNVCGWDGDRCKIKVKNSLREGTMFNRLVSTLVDNAKLRGMVLDGRSTPFFSTILYVELPHELIITDNDLK
jgi:hypothetical protein